MAKGNGSSGGSPASVAVAESCTGGMLMSRIVETPGCGDWFRGGIVAYHPEVKFGLLAVPEGPVVTRRAALAMAVGVRSLLGAEIGLGITGVAGPEEEEGQPVGTVFVGVSHAAGDQVARLCLEGDPYQIRSGATNHAFRQALYAQKVVGEMANTPAERSHRLAIPEGGFVVECRYPLVEATIAGTRVCFAVEGDHSKRTSFAVVGLNGERVPEVLLSATNSEPSSPGRRNGGDRREFIVPRGSKLSLTWNRVPR
ncbi:MAG TPA: CinA family protein [Acidimicrobiia bacterium]|nr:CinA family protein [Acidimicrobiia bacterium]